MNFGGNDFMRNKWIQKSVGFSNFLRERLTSWQCRSKSTQGHIIINDDSKLVAVDGNGSWPVDNCLNRTLKNIHH